jgi:hypothetical protein
MALQRGDKKLNFKTVLAWGTRKNARGFLKTKIQVHLKMGAFYIHKRVGGCRSTLKIFLLSLLQDSKVLRVISDVKKNFDLYQFTIIYTCS